MFEFKSSLFATFKLLRTSLHYVCDIAVKYCKDPVKALWKVNLSNMYNELMSVNDSTRSGGTLEIYFRFSLT